MQQSEIAAAFWTTPRGVQTEALTGVEEEVKSEGRGLEVEEPDTVRRGGDVSVRREEGGVVKGGPVGENTRMMVITGNIDTGVAAGKHTTFLRSHQALFMIKKNIFLI